MSMCIQDSYYLFEKRAAIPSPISLYMYAYDVNVDVELALTIPPQCAPISGHGSSVLL